MTAPAPSQALLATLLEPAQRPDPYPVYRQLLEGGPLQMPENNLHVLSSFADCDEVLRHPASCADRLKSTVAQRAIAAGEQPRPFGTPGFLFLDPPDHTRLRRLVSKAFSPKVVKALEPDIAAMVDGLLDKVADAAWEAVHGDKVHTYVGKTAHRMAFAARWMPGALRKRMRRSMTRG